MAEGAFEPVPVRAFCWASGYRNGAVSHQGAPILLPSPPPDWLCRRPEGTSAPTRGLIKNWR
eukprot:15461917-Alexandrium_andersonii.AAC.1